MALLIVLPNRDEDALKLATNLRNIDRSIKTRIWPDIGDAGDVEMIVSRRHPPGIFGAFPNLRLVAAFGAGVEELLKDDDLRNDVAIARTVDPALITGMAEYVVTAIADWRRGWREFSENQKKALWRPLSYPFSSSVLLMGAGSMGSAVADALIGLGHQVTAWSRTGRPVAGAKRIVGRQALEEAIPNADAVVCLLPLTSETEGIINEQLFSLMKAGSLLVNVGRGGHLVEHDLLPALAKGRPGQAVLDVFQTEPLPPEHPFWNHPKITITPHIAALTDPLGAAERIVENWQRMRSGEALLDVVDRKRGY